MMTWVSPRSGMASRGTVAIAHHPAMQATATTAKTSGLLRTENSTMRSITSDASAIGCGVVLRLLLERRLASGRAEVVRDSVIRDGVSRGGRRRHVDYLAALRVGHPTGRRPH